MQFGPVTVDLMYYSMCSSRRETKGVLNLRSSSMGLTATTAELLAKAPLAH